MAGELSGRRIAILAADGVERVELERPRDALEGAGAETALLSIKTGHIAARNQDLEDAGTFPVDREVHDATPAEFDALLLPGGTVNPDKLRMDTSAVDFVRAFVDSGKPVAAICHGPWTLVEADRVRGRRLTSWPSLRTDLRNAEQTSSTSRWSPTETSPPAGHRTTYRRSVGASSRSSPKRRRWPEVAVAGC